MRVVGGVHHENPDHWRNHFYECPLIKLEGTVVDHVNEANEEEGYVVVICCDANGKIITDKTGLLIKSERRFGRVEIIGVKRN